MGEEKAWNSRWWALVKAERCKSEQRLRAGGKRAKRVAAVKKTSGS